MNRHNRRSWGAGCAALGLALACKVDMAGITFVDDNLFDDNVAGDPGSTQQAGSTSASGGSPTTVGTGGKVGTAGKPSGGSASAGTTSVTGGAGGGGVMPMAGASTGGSAVACPTPRADPAQPLLDDFEDGEPRLPMPMMAGRVGGWYFLNDGSGEQLPMSSETMPPRLDMPGYDGKGYALHTWGTDFSEWGAGVGVTLLGVPGRLPCPYDVSRHSGVRFYLKGVVDGVDEGLRFHLITTEVADVAHGGMCDVNEGKCFDAYSYDINPVPTAWKRIEIPFAALEQGGWGVPAPLLLNHVVNMELVTAGPVVSFDYWIDQVEFY